MFSRNEMMIVTVLGFLWATRSSCVPSTPDIVDLTSLAVLGRVFLVPAVFPPRRVSTAGRPRHRHHFASVSGATIASPLPAIAPVS